MRLHFSKTSPFVRKVLVCAHELGVADRIELIDEYDGLSSTNPLSKVPALITDDGRAIYDSLVICFYLDAQSESPMLIPEEPAARLDVLLSHALTNGVMDAVVSTVMERARPEQKQWGGFRTDQRGKAERALDSLESQASALNGSIDLASISLGAMLGYLDLRMPELDWRNRCSGLAAWYEVFSARPSMRATDPLV